MGMRHVGSTWRVWVLAAAAAACSTSPPATDSKTPPTPQPSPSAPDASWERQAGAAFENRGVAKVERLGTRWMLTVMCNGTHSTYLDDTKIDLNNYAKGFVNARYTWVTRQVDVKCPVAPCPRVNERRIALEKLTPVTMTDARAKELASTCK
jgi:hypothetical protein